MSKFDTFSQSEQELIRTAQKTLGILAKVMDDRYPQGVMQDMDLTAVLRPEDGVGAEARNVFLEKIAAYIDINARLDDADEAALKKAIREALTADDPEKEITEAVLEARMQALKLEIQKAIAVLTPDLPSANATEEAVIIGQLGANIFAKLLEG